MQPDLANTLEAIAKDGPRAFYQGPIAQKLAAAVQAAGGVMTVDDLKDYRADRARRRCAAPIAATTSSRCRRRHRAASRSSRCSTSSKATTWRTTTEAQTLFLMIEAMKRAYADRAWFLGDPDMVQMPVARLISKRLRRSMARDHRSRACDAGERHPPRRHCRRRKAATPRISRSSIVSAMRSPTPTRSISAMASASSPTAPAFCSTTSSTISPPSPTRRMPMG